MKKGWLAILLSALAAVASAQDPKKPAREKVDQARVDAAIKKGIEYLRAEVSKDTFAPFKHGAWEQRYDELVLLTFVHAGVPESYPEFEKLFKHILETDLERTYLVSLQAMILEEIDRVKYQWRIHQCAQFLVDNQAKNGQWSYGDPSLWVKDIPTGSGAKDVATGGGRDKPVSTDTRDKPKVLRRVTVKKEKDGPDRGDNSNSQYAALGLRACHDAGVLIPKDVIEDAARWWRSCQYQDKGKAKDGNGWSYGWFPGLEKDAYGSMTAGAIGAVVIYDYIGGRSWKRDRDVLDGLEWIAKHFSVKGNPPFPQKADKPLGQTSAFMYYYYLYALERAGILFGTETFGTHEWYPEGAQAILEAQAANGSWAATGSSLANGIWDTCFAILFLRRATRPLEDVASTDTKKR